MNPEQTSLLSGEEIKAEGLISNASEGSFRASTYDLTIGEIIPGGKASTPARVAGEHLLRPGGMIKVIARESLKLPDGITGHALPRNTLCDHGVLAINIGVVDPGFEGPISSTLINFGSADFALKPGTPFLRVSFHRCPNSPKAAGAQHWERDRYIERVREQVLAYSGSTFLNLDETVRRAAEAAFGTFKNSLILWATVAAVGLALVTIFVPVGASYADRYLTDRRKWEVETQKAAEQKADERYAAAIRSLQAEIAQLRAQVESEKATSRRVPQSKGGRQ